jgi:hypothetical protein
MCHYTVMYSVYNNNRQLLRYENDGPELQDIVMLKIIFLNITCAKNPPRAEVLPKLCDHLTEA